MSAEIRESVFLRCDGVSYGGVRCASTFGATGVQPATRESLEGLARNAGKGGWQVDIRDEGLKGLSADVRCPMHRRPTSSATTTERSES